MIKISVLLVWVFGIVIVVIVVSDLQHTMKSGP